MWWEAGGGIKSCVREVQNGPVHSRHPQPGACMGLACLLHLEELCSVQVLNWVPHVKWQQQPWHQHDRLGTHLCAHLAPCSGWARRTQGDSHLPVAGSGLAQALKTSDALQGHFEAAIADYSTAIRLNPGHCRAYYNRAFSHDRLQQFHAAIADYSKALEIEPGNATAYHNRGSLFERMGK